MHRMVYIFYFGTGFNYLSHIVQAMADINKPIRDRGTVIQPCLVV